MKTSAVSKVSVALPQGKKAKFNLSHDVNTTYDWGSVQPLFGKFMLPDSSLNINLEQLTRLAPMAVPTFGRVKLKNVAHFIPCKEIFPNWDYFLSQEQVSRPDRNSDGAPTVNTFIPTTLPFINNSVLTTQVLAGAKANVYVSGPVGTQTENMWTIARNEATWASPTWSAATTFAREVGQRVLLLANSQIPSKVTLNPLGNYNGYAWNLYRLTRDDNGAIALGSNNLSLTYLPTVTTMYSVPLELTNGNGFTHSFSNEVRTLFPGPDDHITMEGSDLIWEYAGSNPASGISSADRAANSGTPVEGITSTFADGAKIRIVFKLSSFGKRLRKILIGLGYDVNLSNYDNVSLLPLIAFYKAYWDTYAPQRDSNFYTTNCWKFIELCSASNAACDVIAQSSDTNAGTYRNLFRGFIYDLGCCFATDRMDVISAATEEIYGSEANSVQGMWNAVTEVLSGGINTGIDGSTMTGLTPATTNWPGNPAAANQVTLGVLNTPTGTNNARFTQPQLDALKKAYIYINKYSVAGKQIEEILRSHGLGAYVDECKGKFIDATENNIKISDVVATAGTTENPLGDYGGRGLGINQSQFSFSTDKHGYMVILSTIVPESGYVNAPSHENEVISFRQLYNPEFDGLSMEAIQKKNITGCPLVNDATYHDTFGFVPTYTQWKFMSNKANGDFGLNSMKKSLMPYTLDKYVPIGDAGVYKTQPDTAHSGSEQVLCARTFKYQDLPNAGEDWRYINKFPWNGSYNRIFLAQDDGFDWSSFQANNNSSFLYNSFEYDNFLTHNVFAVQYYAHMKPIEDSYNTFDSEHDAPRTSITKA